MGAGKTYWLNEQLLKNKDQSLGIDCGFNTRNSERDLSYIGKDHYEVLNFNPGEKTSLKLFDYIKNSNNIINVGFDEVHLYYLNADTVPYFVNLIRKVIKYTDCKVFLSGLISDENQRAFSPMGDILPLCTDITMLKSRWPCQGCGTENTASYTIFDGNEEQKKTKVGDFYKVLCLNCWRKWEEDIFTKPRNPSSFLQNLP